MFVDIGTAQIFFDVAGTGLAIDGPVMREKPALIVMHGGPGFDHSTMRPYFDRFADTHQVIYIDHRANGRSTGTLESCTLAQWGDDVKAFCDVLGITKPVVYGNSFGGMVAMAYIARHPAHPSKLILSSTAARMHFDETYDIMEMRGGKQARDIAMRFWSTTDDAAIADYLRVCMPFYNPPGANADAVAEGRKRAILRGDVMRYFSTGEMRTMDARPGLANVVCPTLITAGGYDPITPVSCSQEIFEAMPKGVAQLEVIAAAGHGVHRDEPERAEKLYREFLSA